MIAWLIHVTGNPMAPAWYLMVASLLSLVAMYLMAETRAGAPWAPLPDEEEPGLPPPPDQPNDRLQAPWTNTTPSRTPSPPRSASKRSSTTARAAAP